jgi:hypothetical protein
MIVYVLKCDKGMFYVGSTNKSSESKFREQLFTSKYKPIRVIFSKKTYNIFEEDKLVKKYMMKYGIDNVRGGYYSSLNLSKSDINCLKNELFSNNLFNGENRLKNHRRTNNVENKYREEYSTGNNIKNIVKNALNCFI